MIALSSTDSDDRIIRLKFSAITHMRV